MEPTMLTFVAMIIVLVLAELIVSPMRFLLEQKIGQWYYQDSEVESEDFEDDDREGPQ